jgi:hypothetical protein
MATQLNRYGEDWICQAENSQRMGKNHHQAATKHFSAFIPLPLHRVAATFRGLPADSWSSTGALGYKRSTQLLMKSLDISRFLKDSSYQFP